MSDDTQVDSWEDEQATNAENDEHGGLLNQIAKERELATKVKAPSSYNSHMAEKAYVLL